MSPWYLSLIKSPFLSPYKYSLDGVLSSYYSDEDDYLKEVLGSSASLANPLCINEYGEARNKNYFENTLVMVAVRPTYKFTNSLKATAHVAYSLTNTSERYYLPMTGVPSFTVEHIEDELHTTARALHSSQMSIYPDLCIVWQ